MIELNDNSADRLRDAVSAASARDDVQLAIACLYEQLQDAIDLQRPPCDVSGRCCRFEEAGHRLFVTTMELAAFVGQAPPTARAEWDGAGCPFQSNKECEVHAIRPFGCRVFFCDATATDWQNRQYERFHARLKRMHEQLGVPYFYTEWRQALRAIGLAPMGR